MRNGQRLVPSLFQAESPKAYRKNREIVSRVNGRGGGGGPPKS